MDNSSSVHTNSIESHLRLIVPSSFAIPETEYERREGIDSTSNTPFLQTSIIVNRHSVDRIRSFSGEYSCECIAYGTGPEDKAEQVKSMPAVVRVASAKDQFVGIYRVCYLDFCSEGANLHDI
ncbi:hypothetical protein T11_14740 [Trichinella zimbabwensis]|uniref:Netrin receptor UNC5A-D-like N-terminal domain-containing protein n=1 Tax=Trichinella zimbabwensis TaxID=268475 RepID=A0A0V1HU87_9BILA|nr:hypothetical protein T11_14740 [Trichinella zimbabwensis]